MSVNDRCRWHGASARHTAERAAGGGEFRKSARRPAFDRSRAQCSRVRSASSNSTVKSICAESEADVVAAVAPGWAGRSSRSSSSRSSSAAWTGRRSARPSGRPTTCYLAGVVLATVVTYLLRAWRWGYLLAPLARVPFARSLLRHLRRLHDRPARPAGGRGGAALPRLAPPSASAPPPASPRSSSSAWWTSITVLLLFALYLYVLPTPAAQTQGPLLGYLKLGGALAGLAAVAVLAVLLAPARSRRARAGASLRPRCSRRCPRAGSTLGRAGGARPSPRAWPC